MTLDRNALIVAFLRQAGWGAATRTDLVPDASMRRYERLVNQAGETVILMDAPPDANPDIRRFTTIARYLSDVGLSAPQVLGEDRCNGFLLLEDLGDDLFVRLVLKDPKSESVLYKNAVDTLVTLHRENPPDLVHFGAELMAEQASLVFETWVQALNGQVPGDTAARFTAGFQTLLEQKTQGEPVMILRDFHAENLLWLPDRIGVARVGLLDFQDAMLAHPGYDLVSLLQDVRRDVPASLEQEMITHYISQTDQNETGFRDAYAVLGVQRNLRILAVFARLASGLGKSKYARLIPRTWGHLMRGLEHSALAPIAASLTEILPYPSRENLQKLTAK
ncbi:MAG: phosphotransferase [Rhodobacteraceae bacterium]|nr:phosphotransferase [Paracoccaceae bacterium]